MSKQEIEKNLSVIKAELERELASGDITGCTDKLMKLTALSGLSAETMRHSKAAILYRQRDIIERTKTQGLNPSILKMKIEGELYEESALMMYADRLNAAITHAIDALRTVISLYKTEMENSLKT